MNGGLIGAAAVLLLLTISVAWALIRGVTKARIRFVCVLLCAVAAFGITIAARGKLDTAYAQYAPQLRDYLVNNGMEELWNFIDGSENVRTTVAESGGAVLAPIVAVVLFVLLQFVTWVIYFLVTLLLGGSIRSREERRHFRLLRALCYGAAQFVVILFVFVTPVFSYLQFAPAVVRVANDANLIPAQAQATVNEESIEKTSNHPVIKLYAKVGGGKLDKALTKIEVQGETTYLAVEITNISSLTGDVVTLKNAGNVDKWSDREAEAIKSLAKSLGNSKIIASMIGDVLGNATDKWLAGEDFFGVKKPSVGEYLDPTFDLLLRDLNQDSQSLTAISDDLETIGDLLAILVRDGVLAKINDTDSLADMLTKGTTVKEMIRRLEQNETMSNLVSEFTRLGMKAVGNMLQLPEVDLSDYEEFFDEVTVTLNEVLENTDFSRKESVDAAIGDLTEKVQAELDKANVNVQLSDEIIDLYSDLIIDQFKDKEGAVTIDDLKELFGIEIPTGVEE